MKKSLTPQLIPVANKKGGAAAAAKINLNDYGKVSNPISGKSTNLQIQDSAPLDFWIYHFSGKV